MRGTSFRYADARAAGVSSGRLRSGDLIAPFRGIRSPEGALDLEQRCHAFQLRMPRGGFFNSLTAARLMGAPLPYWVGSSPVIHVAVPAPSTATVTRGVVGHTVRLMGDDVRVIRGMSISSPERMWCELGSKLSLSDLVAVGDWLIHWRLPLSSAESLRDALERYPGGRGRRSLRLALTLLDARAESPQESRLRVMLVTAGIRGFESNYPIRVRGRNYRADFAFPRRRLILEYQGDHHRDREQWQRDLTRRSILATDSWFTMELGANDLRDRAELIARVRMTLASRPVFP